MIPSAGPFSVVTCPHYSFELLTWFGYALHSGANPMSLLLLTMSVAAMAPFAADRHARYVELWRAGKGAKGDVDPSSKWKMVPGLW